MMLLTLGAFSSYAQTFKLTMQVDAVTDDNLEGLSVSLSNPAYGLVYPTKKLSATGSCSISSIVEGTYTLQINATSLGLENYVDENLQLSSDSTLVITLKEKTQQPYALKATTTHDVESGKNSILLGWNVETDYFFDDFESYDAFAIDFAPWTGIDIDKANAAQLSGSYSNNALPQYAMIFNPLKVEPTLWYSYPVLHPYSGYQYAAFIRNDTEANNDWLISPQVTVGIDNEVRFMVKSGDVYEERYRVAISTTGTDLADFTYLTTSNYETVGYAEWNTVTYDLSSYEGMDIYVAIQCISDCGFMMMVDDFYIGPSSNLNPVTTLSMAKTRRVDLMAAQTANYEKFVVYLNGDSVATTTDIEYLFDDVEAGDYTLGVKATYRIAETPITTVETTVEDDVDYAGLYVTVSTDNGLAPNDVSVIMLNITDGAEYTLAVDDLTSAVGYAYLGKGKYSVTASASGYSCEPVEVTVTEDTTINVELVEEIAAPYNITCQSINEDTETGKVDVEVKWNQDLGFFESFEEYDDFAQEFGEWQTIDYDNMTPYGVSLSGTTVDFPGNMLPSAGMIFNPYQTTPSMEEDGYMLAADGDKYVAFFSAEQAISNDWLIAPQQRIERGYVLTFYAKSYEAFYPESVRIMISESDETATFTELDYITLPAGSWQGYEIDLSDYAGKNVYIAFNYVSYDTFLMQLDMVYIGPSDLETGVETVSSATFTVSLDGVEMGTTEDTSFTLAGLTPGSTHTVAVTATYASGSSETAECEFTVGYTDGIAATEVEKLLVASSKGVITVALTDDAPSILNLYGVDGALHQQVVLDGASMHTLPAQSGVYVVELISSTGAYRQKVVVK